MMLAHDIRFTPLASVTMLWLLLFTVAAQAANFNISIIPSDPHHQYTTDTSLLVWPWRSYKTSHHHPPHMKITRPNRRPLAPGYIFVSPANSNNEDGTYELSGTGFIMDYAGDLVYAAEETGMDFCDAWIGGMTDFRAQEFNGKKVITYWNGCNHKGQHWGHRWGRVTFIDEEYDNFTMNPDLGINTLDDAPRGQIDVHEHQMTDRNTMLVTSYNNTQYDLRSANGTEDGWVADGMFFEIDPITDEVMFEWRALDHLQLNASRFGSGNNTSEANPWDWLHINSVHKVGDNYLISARHHWAIYLISGKDGSVIWKLDGIDGGSFGSIPAKFRWQHHARAHNVSEAGMTVSLFNNMVNGKKTEEWQTQGLAFWLPMPANADNPPVLVKRLETPNQMLFAGTQGSYQMDLGNGDQFGKGNGFIGYGLVPIAREYGPADDGSDLRWQAQFGHEKAVMNYRSFKMEWKGTPKNWDPVVVIEDPRVHRPRVYVSWNGATDIGGWAVFAGEDALSLKSVGVANKKSFETVIQLDGARCVQIGAVRNGDIIRLSNLACLDSSDDSALGNQPGGAHGSYAYTQAEYEDLEAEMEQIEAEKEKLREEKNELEQETWAAYRLFAEVALLVILVVAGAWVYVLWRDWRRRGQYAHVPDNELGPFGLGFGLPRWKRGTPKLEVVDGVAIDAAEYDERKLDDMTPRRYQTKDMEANDFELADDEDDEDETSDEKPFIERGSEV